MLPAGYPNQCQKVASVNTKHSLLVAAGIASAHEHPLAIVVHNRHAAKETVEGKLSKAHAILEYPGLRHALLSPLRALACRSSNLWLRKPALMACCGRWLQCLRLDSRAAVYLALPGSLVQRALELHHRPLGPGLAEVGQKDESGIFEPITGTSVKEQVFR